MKIAASAAAAVARFRGIRCAWGEGQLTKGDTHATLLTARAVYTAAVTAVFMAGCHRRQ